MESSTGRCHQINKAIEWGASYSIAMIGKGSWIQGLHRLSI